MKQLMNRQHNRRGAAIVEMALVLPIFFGVVLGIVEFGRAMMVSQMVTNAAREGTRLAIIDGSTNTTVETWVEEFLNDSINVIRRLSEHDRDESPEQPLQRYFP